MRLIALLVFLTACDALTSFDVDQTIPEQTIPGSPIPAVLQDFLQAPLDIDISGQIDAMDPGPIDSITLKSLTLTIKTPDDDWAFLESCELFVESTKSGTTLPRVKVATARLPAGATAVSFDPEGVNLKAYIDEGSRLTAEATGEAPPDPVTYDGHATFTVHVL